MALDPTKHADWEIAQEAESRMKTVYQIGEELGIEKEELLPYGHYVAKLDFNKIMTRTAAKPDGKYVDVPAVPNILMQRITIGSAMIFDVRGQVCILFRLPSNNLQEIFTNTDNFMVQPGGSFNCFMVPRAWVIDGIENVRLDDRGVFKRLPNSIDVGYIQHRGSREKVSIKRKVKEDYFGLLES